MSDDFAGRCPSCDAPSSEHPHADWCEVGRGEVSANVSLATTVIAAAIQDRAESSGSGFTVGVLPVVKGGEIMVTVNGVLFRLTVEQS